jgi:hypothetical protein
MTQILIQYASKSDLDRIPMLQEHPELTAPGSLRKVDGFGGYDLHIRRTTDLAMQEKNRVPKAEFPCWVLQRLQYWSIALVRSQLHCDLLYNYYYLQNQTFQKPFSHRSIAYNAEKAPKTLENQLKLEYHLLKFSNILITSQFLYLGWERTAIPRKLLKKNQCHKFETKYRLLYFRTACEFHRVGFWAIPIPKPIHYPKLDAANEFQKELESHSDRVVGIEVMGQSLDLVKIILRIEAKRLRSAFGPRLALSENPIRR